MAKSIEINADSFEMIYIPNIEKENWYYEFFSNEQKIEYIKQRRQSILESTEDKNRILELIKLNKKGSNNEEIKGLYNKNKLIIDEDEYIQLKKAEKQVIRMDYWGVVNKIDEEHLSNFYKKAKDEPKKKKYKLDKYDLSKSPSWQLFAQFKNFRKIETKVKEQLRDTGVHPEDLPKMAVEDYMDAMFNKFPKNIEGYHSQLFLGAKCSFIKDFIKKFEKPFSRILKEAGVDERYIKELVKNMKSNGICENFKVLDENGKDIEGIKLSVHHKNNVSNAGNKAKIGEVNLFSNLCLCIDEPWHTRILHAAALENKRIEKNGKTFRSSVQFEDKDMVFFAGFSPSQQISYYYSEDERVIRAQNELLPYEDNFITNQKETLDRKIRARNTKTIFNNRKSKESYKKLRKKEINDVSIIEKQTRPTDNKSVISNAMIALNKLKKSMKEL